jgi:hypothetical protein
MICLSVRNETRAMGIYQLKYLGYVASCIVVVALEGLATGAGS